MTQFDVAEAAVQAALDAGARYADARVMERRYESMAARDGEIEDVSQDEDAGVGVRALVGSGWGFFALPDLSDDAARRAGRTAAEVAAASARVARREGTLIDAEAVAGSWASECLVDPLEVGLAEKGDLLVRATATMREHGADLAEGLYQVWDTAKWLVSSDGHRVDQRIRECGAGIMATAIGDGETQRRSYPAARGQYGTRGWELVREIDLQANAARVGEEAKALLSAPPCPSGETTLVLGDEQMALQIHESVGHAIELDRILGWEAAYAGTSWLDLAQLGSLQYGSELMNITIDPTIAGGLGSFGFDDEGTPAAARDAVREGRWVGVLAGRDSAAVAGLDYGGSVRADGWARLPMVRMTNVGLEPGPHTLEEIIASTDDGIFMDTNRSWSIDDKRLNFQFGCEIGYEIKDGQLGRMLRNPTYTGIGPQFWRSMDMLSSETVAWGTPNCGKGQPGQIGHTGHPAAPAGSATSAWGCGRERLHRRAPLRSGGGELGRRASASRGAGGAGVSVSSPASLAARVLELASASSSGAEIEVAVDQNLLALTRFANSVIHQNVADDGVGVRLRLHRDGRTAGGSTTRIDDDGLRALVERTVAAVAVAPADPGWPGLAPPGAAGPVAPLDASTAEATPDDRAAVVAAFVEAAGGLETAGYCRTIHSKRALANSAGQAIEAESAEVGVDGIARADGADGVARAASGRLADIDGAALGARAAAKARAGADPVELPPDRYQVVLEPTAVADLLQSLSWFAFNAKSVADRVSFVRLGDDQFDRAVTLVDDAPATGDAFDADGTPRRRTVLVDGGTTVSLTHDLRTAAAAGTTTTGHGVGAPSFGALARHLRLEPDGPPGDGATDEVEGPVVDAATAELVAGMERGILVTDLWYTRVLDPRTLAVTGLTRNGVWLVEGGEVVQALRNFRFTQSYAQALMPGAVTSVGRVAHLLPGDTYTAYAPRWTAPALHLASWNFTGGASG